MQIAFVESCQLIELRPFYIYIYIYGIDALHPLPRLEESHTAVVVS
jgi:hypothetical protein